MAQDFAENELAVEQFALKFGTPEKAKAFHEAFENAKNLNAAAMGTTSTAETEGDAATTNEADDHKDE
jgi:hypothetical protein